MTATTQPRKTMQMEGNPLPVVLSYPIKADEVLYQGTLAMLDGSGRLIAGKTATGCQTIGKFDNNEPVTDCTGLADGDVIGTVYPGVWKWFSGTGPDVITAAEVGELAYTIDNQTVGLTDGGATRSIAGTIFGVDSEGRVYVYSNLSPGVDGTALAAEIVARQDFEADIASTANGEGASMVGVEDAAGLTAAATVEAVLAELLKAKVGFGIAPQALSGAGAVNVTSLVTLFTSTGAAQALSLANGTQTGQLKIVHHTVDGGSGVLTPTTAGNFATFTLTNVHDACLLQWSGTAWNILMNVGGTVA